MSFFLPQTVYASLDSTLANINAEIINPLIGFLFALAIGYFLYGMFEFISNQENEEAKTNGRSHMIWGVIGLAVMMGVWGILNLVLNTLGVTDIKIDTDQNAGKVDVDLRDYDPTFTD